MREGDVVYYRVDRVRGIGGDSVDVRIAAALYPAAVIVFA